MKKIKLLLPLALSAGVVTAIVPFAASCGKSTAEVIDGLEEIDSSDLYQFGPGTWTSEQAVMNLSQLIFTVEHSADPDYEEYKDAFKKDLMYGRYMIGEAILEGGIFEDPEINYFTYTIDTLKLESLYVYQESTIALYSFKSDVNIQITDHLTNDDNEEITEITTLSSHLDAHYVPINVIDESESPFGQNSIVFVPPYSEGMISTPLWMHFATDWYYNCDLSVEMEQTNEDTGHSKKTVGKGSIHEDINNILLNPEDLPDIFNSYGAYFVAWPSYCFENIIINNPK